MELERLAKRIVCTVSNDLSYDQRMIRICTALAEAGYDVLLAGRELPDSVPLKNEAFRQERLKCIFLKGPLFYLELNLRLFFLLIRSGCLAIYSVDLDTVPGARLAQLFRRKLWIFDAHEFFTEVPEVVDRPVVKRIWSQVERMILNRADLVITVSDSIANVFKKSAKSHVVVIRNVPFLRSRSVNHMKKNLKKLIYQGALNEGRCVEAYIEALTELEDVELILAGEGDLSTSLRDLSRRLKVEDRVHFLGRVDPDVLWEHTCSADLGLNVLEHKGQSYYYSLSNKCFDYMQAGIPQLCSDFPEYRTLNDTWDCMVFAEPDAHDIAEKIKWLLHDRETYNKMAQNAELAANQLNWEIEKLKLQSVYESIG